MKLLILVAVGVLFSIPALSQSFSANADSIKKVLETSPRDTNRVKMLLALGHILVFKSGEANTDLDSAVLLSQQAYALSHSLGYLRGKGLSFMICAQAYREKGNRPQARRFTQRAVDLLVRYGSKEDQADACIELANYYENSGQDLNEQIHLYDRAIPLLQQTTNKLKLANALHDRGDLYQIRSDYPQSLQDLQGALGLYRSIGYADLQGIYKLIGSVYERKSKYAEALKYDSLALRLAEQRKDSYQQSLILSQISGTHGKQGKLQQAFNEQQSALSIQKIHGYKEIYDSYLSLSSLSCSQGYFNIALFYNLEALKRAIDNGDIEKQIYAYYVLGYVYFQANLVEKSIEAFKKSLAISRQKNQPIDARMATLLTRALLKKGKASEGLQFLRTMAQHNAGLGVPATTNDKRMMAEGFGTCYAALKQDQRAERYFKESIALGKQSDYDDCLIAYLGASRFFVSRGQYTKARPYINQLLAAPPGIVPPNALKDVHLLSYKADSATGNYLIAIAHYQQYKIMNDSLFNIAKSRQFDELQVQYETSQKEQRIQRLMQKELRQRSELDRTKMTRNGIISGAGMLALLLGLSYNRYWLKSRSNRLLEMKQTEINQKNHSLQTLLEEKEWLLKEIHHRVKNNLQIISSLLHSQGIFLKDEAAQSAIRESQNRVHAMALIHQKLYQSERLTAIPMAGYVTEIVDYLIQSFDREDTVRKQISLAPIDLDVTLAVPLGLIINEAVTNSLKHAFPSNQTGIIGIALKRLDSQTYQLTIKDNGIGLPADIHPNRSQTLGMSLIQGLSKQLSGLLQIYQNDGVQISLTFKEEKITRSELMYN
ncbi:histidine kinase [Spirosoma sp. HMF3257]|nr:histidine kinase [Spirosoma telluris]